MIEVSSEQSRSQFYFHTSCCWRCCFCCVLILLFSCFCYVDTVLSGFTTEYLDLIDNNCKVCTLLHDVRVCMYSYIPACCYVVCCSTVLAAAAATWRCFSSSCGGWKNMFPWFTAFDSRVYLVFILTRFFSMYPLAVLYHFQRRYFDLQYI